MIIQTKDIFNTSVLCINLINLKLYVQKKLHSDYEGLSKSLFGQEVSSPPCPHKHKLTKLNNTNRNDRQFVNTQTHLLARKEEAANVQYNKTIQTAHLLMLECSLFIYKQY